ncbi:MAG: hypothetical protein WC346_02175 [Methanogenium sp.]
MMSKYQLRIAKQAIQDCLDIDGSINALLKSEKLAIEKFDINVDIDESECVVKIDASRCPILTACDYKALTIRAALATVVNDKLEDIEEYHYFIVGVNSLYLQ